MKKFGLNYEKYFSEGESRKTLVFLHGLTGNTGRWKEYIEDLKEKFNILAIDLIGHGNSDFPDKLQKFSFESQAESIEKILQEERLSELNLVCHSYSYSIGKKLAVRGKIKLSGLILISPFFTQTRERSFRKSCIGFLMKFWKFLYHQRKARKFRYPKTSKKPSFLDHQRAIKEIGLKSYLAHLYFCFYPEEQKSERKIKIPSLLIYKEGDTLCSGKIRKTLEETLPNLHEEQIPGKGHLFLIEDGKQIISALEGNLRKRKGTCLFPYLNKK